jgi:hypothetical protein
MTILYIVLFLLFAWLFTYPFLRILSEGDEQEMRRQKARH